MKRLTINALALCLLMLISFRAFSQSTSEMKIFITKTNQEMMDLVKSGNYNGLDKYYDADAVSLPNYRAKESGYKLILNNNLGRQKGGYKILDGQKTTTQLILGQDMMVDIGIYSLKITFPGLTEPKVDNGKYLNVWKKNQEGVWKLVAETWNADKSPNAPASKGQGQAGGTPAPTMIQNPKPGAQTGTQTGTTSPGTAGSDGKSTQPGATKTVTMPPQGASTTKSATETKSTQAGTTKTVTVPATGTKTTIGTTETETTQTGTAKTEIVPAQGTTTKTSIDTIQKPMDVPNGGKK
jgi:ketosteroid isomerase-like protein